MDRGFGLSVGAEFREHLGDFLILGDFLSLVGDLVVDKMNF